MSNVVNLPKDDADAHSSGTDKYLLSEVSVTKRTDSKFPIVLIKDTGLLHEHANEFLLMRFNHPSFIDEELEEITETTLKNYADHIRYWLNICSLLDTSYLSANYSFMTSVLKTMRVEGTEEGSISNYVSTWRLFYKYLDKVNVPNLMDLPSKVSTKRMLSDAEQEGDFLNYTKESTETEYEKDPLIDDKRIKRVSSYNSQVLNIEQMRALISELRKIDVVYAVMAKVQFDTCLRLNELITYFPHTSNTLNPKFMSWGEMYTKDIRHQTLKFIGKGQIEREIDVDIQTMKLISDKYLTAKMPNSDITIYADRKLKFQTTYLSTKAGKDSRYKIDSDILWIKEDGTPISKSMYQKAFRDARKALYQKEILPLNINVRPHAMRHTGASLRLVKYRQETGIDIHIDNDGDIHAFLKGLLGHEKLSTTHKYIRTVRNQAFSNLALKTIIRNEDLWVDEIAKNSTLRKGVESIKAQK